MEFSKIKALREGAGLTQDKLGARVGVRQSTVAMWETGASTPRSVILPKLAEALGCSIDDLFNSDDDPAATA
jgi:transcriptional regulator with XRE-family HTH domain